MKKPPPPKPPGRVSPRGITLYPRDLERVEAIQKKLQEGTSFNAAVRHAILLAARQLGIDQP